MQRPRRLPDGHSRAGGPTRRVPQAEITLLAAAWHAAFLSGRPGPVDRVLVVPRVPGLAGQPAGAPPEEALSRFLADARPYRYDLAVQLHGGGAVSNPLTRALGARWSIGLRAEGTTPLDATVPYRYYQSEVFRLLEVVGLVGAEGRPEYPEPAVFPHERAAAVDLLPDDGPWAALHAGAGDPRRRWPAERFATVADGLAAAGIRPVLVGSVADEPASAAVRAAAHPTSGTSPGAPTSAPSLRCCGAASSSSRTTGAPAPGPGHGRGDRRAVLVRQRDQRRADHPEPAPPAAELGGALPGVRVDTSTAGFPQRPGEGCAHRPSFLGQIPVAEVLDEALDLAGRSPAEELHDAGRSPW